MSPPVVIDPLLSDPLSITAFDRAALEGQLVAAACSESARSVY